MIMPQPSRRASAAIFSAAGPSISSARRGHAGASQPVAQSVQLVMRRPRPLRRQAAIVGIADRHPPVGIGGVGLGLLRQADEVRRRRHHVDQIEPGLERSGIQLGGLEQRPVVLDQLDRGQDRSDAHGTAPGAACGQARNGPSAHHVR